MTGSNPINIGIRRMKTPQFSLQRTDSKSHHDNHDDKGDPIFSQLYASKDDRNNEQRPKQKQQQQKQQQDKRRAMLLSAGRLNNSAIRLFSVPLRRRAPNDSSTSILSDTSFHPAKCGVRFNCQKSKVHIVEPLVYYMNEIWWSKVELEQYHHIEKIKNNYQDLPSSQNVDENDIDDDPLKSYLLAYHMIREEFAAVCQKTQGTKTTAKSFADLSKIHQERLMYGLNHYGYHGIEHYVGDDAAKRRLNIRQHVRKTIAYYKLKKDKLNSTAHSTDTARSNDSHSIDDSYETTDHLQYAVRKFAESNTVHDRYWARFMGNAASK